MSKQLLENNFCFIRNQGCKRFFSGSRICFIACPNADEISLELEIIKDELLKVNVEPYIAVDHRDYHKDIFCEKICSKIIESLFCIAILNDVKSKKTGNVEPNSNVYYEYGMMTALNKHIIPVQKRDHTLAFNIQSLDTLKYDNKSFKEELHSAIVNALQKIEIQEKTQKLNIKNKFIYCLDFLGLIKSHPEPGIIDIIGEFNFEVYKLNTDSNRLFFVGFFDEKMPEDDILFNLKILSKRILNNLQRTDARLTVLEGNSRGLFSTSGSSVIERRKSEFERFKYQLSSAMFIIVKPDIKDIDNFLSKYKKIQEELKSDFNIDVIDNERATSILESTE